MIMMVIATYYRNPTVVTPFYLPMFLPNCVLALRRSRMEMRNGSKEEPWAMKECPAASSHQECELDQQEKGSRAISFCSRNVEEKSVERNMG